MNRHAISFTVAYCLLTGCEKTSTPDEPAKVDDVSKNVSDEQSVAVNRFGVEAENTILIYISGSVTFPGKYYVPDGTGLKSVLGRAGGFTWDTHYTIETNNGRLSGVVSIFREGKRTQYSIAKLQLTQHEDVALQNDDTIDFHYRPFF